MTGGQAVPDNGLLFLGEKGKLMVKHLSGDHWSITQGGAEAFQVPDGLRADSPDHHLEWIRACKTGGPTSSPFSQAAVLTEAILLGNVAYRVGQKLEWDAPNMRASHCPEADRYIRREYRKGWTL
jgi:hypothetical protein